VIHLVVLGEAGSQENAAQMDVVGYVAAAELPERHTEVASQYLDGHGRLLLADAGEILQAPAQFCRCRGVRPEGGGGSVVLVEDDLRCLDQPSGNVVDEPVQHGFLPDRGQDGFGIGG